MFASSAFDLSGVVCIYHLQSKLPLTAADMYLADQRYTHTVHEALF